MHNFESIRFTPRSTAKVTNTLDLVRKVWTAPGRTLMLGVREIEAATGTGKLGATLRQVLVKTKGASRTTESSLPATYTVNQQALAELMAVVDANIKRKQAGAELPDWILSGKIPSKAEHVN